MSGLSFRQIHLDFHTSEVISDIGKKFSKEQFQSALKTGHVNSITVFSKCHHGWAYHPSKANKMHPGLDFDLMGEMINAAKEIGVKTPVYLSAGFDEKIARCHTDWLMRSKDEKLIGYPDFFTPGYHHLCLNTPYLDVLLEQIKEVVENYDADGIFLDIVSVQPCYCQFCVGALLKQGKDPRNEEAAMQLAESVYANYTERVRAVIDSVKPGMRVFHNGGHIRRGRRDLANMNTHLELESLPTGGWGYDHFPISARYVQNLDMEYLGMTGKFHTTWGEFGGYKHPNALRYEAALSIANGARCSIGDQLHPSGLMDNTTYSIIGKAYSEVEAKEEWCTNVINIADVAILSCEGAGMQVGNEPLPSAKVDAGVARMLLEGKILFDIIDKEESFNKYKVIILPDYILIDNKLKEKFNDYCNNGGKLLVSGYSGLNETLTGFELDMGVKWLCENPYKPDYFKPHFNLASFEQTGFVFYCQGQKIELDGGKELGARENPYFNRDLFTFCSHQHTPNSMEYGGPGMVQSQKGIYIAWNIFEDYATKGSLPLKETVLHAIDFLLGAEKTLETNLPAQGVSTVMFQREKNRYVNHILYAVPVKRGENIEVIEDIVPLFNINVSLKLKRTPKRIYLAPQMEEINYEISYGVVSYIVPSVKCHQMVVIDCE